MFAQQLFTRYVSRSGAVQLRTPHWRWCCVWHSFTVPHSHFLPVYHWPCLSTTRCALHRFVYLAGVRLVDKSFDPIKTNSGLVINMGSNPSQCSRVNQTEIRCNCTTQYIAAQVSQHGSDKESTCVTERSQLYGAQGGRGQDRREEGNTSEGGWVGKTGKGRRKK